MASKRKRRRTTIKFNPMEKQVLRDAARLEGIGWTTYTRVKSVGCARRQLKRHEEAKTASDANR